MNKKLILLLVVVGLMGLPIPTLADQVYDCVTYWGWTEDNVQVAWDAVAEAQFYRLKMHHMENGVDVAVGRVDAPVTQATLVFPRSGHYKALVAACVIENGIEECSMFSDSTDPRYASVNGQPQGWWIYRTISPPGPIE